MSNQTRSKRKPGTSRSANLIPTAIEPLITSIRSSGVLMHITSISGRRYNGDLGSAAYRFADFLHLSGQKWWQTLPVNPVGDGNSPYSTISCFAGEPLMISIEMLYEDGLLTKRDTAFPEKTLNDSVNYQAARSHRIPLLRKAYENSLKCNKFYTSTEFRAFKRATKYWLDDFTLFYALGADLKTWDWSTWPKGLRLRQHDALKQVRKDFSDEIRFLEFQQYQFYRQWNKLKAYCNNKNVCLMGDIPIFVSLASSDVWGNQQFFQLTKSGKPLAVAGVPPDQQTPEGQLWGNALYHWKRLKGDGYTWWLHRFRQQLTLFDGLRLDHFIGFHRYWRIPAHATTARTGSWKRGPGKDFFHTIIASLGKIPLIAEDLGLIVPEVIDLRDEFSLPGMKVLQFGFGSDSLALDHRIHNFDANSVVYPGTHDNDTCIGWYQSMVKAGKAGTARKYSNKTKCEQEQLHRYRSTLPPLQSPVERNSMDSPGKSDKSSKHPLPTSGTQSVAWDFIRHAFNSPANLAIIQMQDILSLDSTARMNIPGRPKGNWEWRATKVKVAKELSQGLYDLGEFTQRIESATKN